MTVSSGWKRPLLLAGVCWGVFAAVLAAAYWLPVARWADGWAVEGFLNLQRPRLNSAAFDIATLANPLPFAVATVALASIALYRGRPRQALAAIVLLGGANVVAQALKLLLAHERTHEFLGRAQLDAVSFPSGHATASMSLAFAAVLVAPAAWRPLVAAAGALFALVVSESIMLLAWHFPSDVIGGFLVATASALTVVAALRAADARWPDRTGREAARRAIGRAQPARTAAIAAGFAAAGLIGLAVAAGDRTLSYASRHTLAFAAVVAVAAMAAALPAAVAGLSGARRP
jgi:membrane-associated phospholipid phosphatase